MRIRPLSALALATALCATAGASAAVALPASILALTDRTAAHSGSGQMPPYGAALHQEILLEIRRNDLPFRAVSLIRVQAVFAVDRRGRLIHFSLRKTSGSPLVDGYVEEMVRKASARFPTPPANLQGDVVAFTIPITFAPDIGPDAAKPPRPARSARP